jgi:hypothetical protein
VESLITGVSPRTRVIAALLAVVAFVGLWLAMNEAMEPAGEYSIVDFEFASTPERATKILDAWGADGRNGARRAIWLDYGWLVAYSVLLTLACGGLALAAFKRGMLRLSGFGWKLTAFVPIAGMLDAVENTALLIVLNGFAGDAIGSAAPFIAAEAAGVKFAIVIVALLYIFAAASWLALARASD